MKRIISLFMTLFMMCSICSCTATVSYEPKEKIPAPQDSDSWSVFIYMCSQNNGRSCKAIEDMCSLEYSENVNIVVEAGGSGEWDISGMNPDYIQRFVMQKGAPYLVDQKPNSSMGDYRTLAEFLQWGTENYPAKNNILVFMGGGDGLTVLNDSNYSNDSLTLEEAYYAISLCPQTFDVIGFDGGSMASLEMATALSPYASYMIADETRSIGWNYKNLAEYIMEYPKMSVKDFAVTIADDCLNRSLETPWSKMIDISVIDLSRMSEVLQTFDAISYEMYNQTNSLSSLGSLQRIINTVMRCPASDNIDLGSLANALAPSFGDAAALMNDALKNAIVYHAAGDYRQSSSGISVFYPETNDENKLVNYIENSSCETYKMYLGRIAPYINSPQYASSSQAWDEYGAALPGVNAYVDGNSKFCLAVEPDMNAVKDVKLNKYMDINGQYLSIGDESSLDCRWDERMYIDNTQPTYLTISNQPLDIHKEYENDQCRIYTAPIMVNDVLSTVCIAYNLITGKYETLGIFEESVFTDIKSSVSVSPVYRMYESADLVKGKTVKLGLSKKVKNKKLPDNTYLYEYELQDVYNTIHRSGVCFMDKQGATQILRQ